MRGVPPTGRHRCTKSKRGGWRIVTDSCAGVASCRGNASPTCIMTRPASSRWSAHVVTWGHGKPGGFILVRLEAIASGTEGKRGDRGPILYRDTYLTRTRTQHLCSTVGFFSTVHNTIPHSLFAISLHHVPDLSSAYRIMANQVQTKLNSYLFLQRCIKFRLRRR